MIILLRTVCDLILTPWYWFTYALPPALDQWLPASWLRPGSWVQYVSDIRKTNVSEEPGLVALISIQQCSSSNIIHLSQWILILNKTKWNMQCGLVGRACYRGTLAQRSRRLVQEDWQPGVWGQLGLHSKFQGRQWKTLCETRKQPPSLHNQLSFHGKNTEIILKGFCSPSFPLCCHSQEGVLLHGDSGPWVA